MTNELIALAGTDVRAAKPLAYLFTIADIGMRFRIHQAEHRLDGQLVSLERLRWEKGTWGPVRTFVRTEAGMIEEVLAASLVAQP